jgi:exopolysaccharide production protein ExoQ
VPPVIASTVWSILFLLAIRYSKDSTRSAGLWLPVVWMFFLSSRLPSQWLGLTPTSATTAFAEGSGFDRALFLVLIALAAWMLATRPIAWGGLVARNSAVTLFLVYALVSASWGDFPFVSFKRWIRDSGAYLMVLLVLSHPDPLEATKTVIRRVTALLLFVSVVLIKYYPQMGVLYNPWSGAPEYAGAATSKNTLGAICLISGVFYFWDMLSRWQERKDPGTRKRLFINGALIGMTLWLLNLANSATSLLCLVIGCAVVWLLQSQAAKAHPRVATAAIPAALVGGVVLQLAFDLSGVIAGLLGRDPTLTGRTGIWEAVLAFQPNPLVGVGYQSFWMGSRISAVQNSLNTEFFLNSAHNGYLEIYLNLGFVGLALLLVILASSYRAIARQLVVSPQFAAFGLALWSVMVIYNVSEVSFGASLMWCVFLLCGVAVPCSAQAPDFKTEQFAAAPRGIVAVHRSRNLGNHFRMPLQNRDRAGADVSRRAVSGKSQRWRSRVTDR